MSDWKNVQYKDGKMRTSEGGGGGASALTDLDDVNVSSPSDGQVLKYDDATNKWVNANESGGGSGHNYSATEQIIGTWTDGKPAYEITIEFTPTGSGYQHDTSGLNIDNLFHIGGTVKQTNGNIAPVPYFAGTNDWNLAYLNSSKKVTCVYAGNYNSAPWKIILKYTKTTD